MNIYEFMSNSPWLTFFLFYLALKAFVTHPLRLVNRWIRHKNIAARGWPPAHLDADGDWKPDTDEE